MAKTNLGKVSLTPRGAYNANTAYERLDIIEHGGSSYIVLKSVMGITPSNDGVNFILIASRGEQGIQGIQGIQGEQGIQGSKGEQGPRGFSGAVPTQDLSYASEVELEPNKEYIIDTLRGSIDISLGFNGTNASSENEKYSKSWLFLIKQPQETAHTVVLPEIEWGELDIAPSFAAKTVTVCIVCELDYKYFGEWLCYPNNEVEAGPYEPEPFLPDDLPTTEDDLTISGVSVEGDGTE